MPVLQKADIRYIQLRIFLQYQRVLERNPRPITISIACAGVGQQYSYYRSTSQQARHLTKSFSGSVEATPILSKEIPSMHYKSKGVRSLLYYLLCDAVSDDRHIGLWTSCITPRAQR
jgi:hypothetical protein